MFSVIIRVPQKIRHIYHHHVKRVPVYVLLPNKKSKVLDDLEDVTKGLPCKEFTGRQEDRALKYRYARYYEAERDSYPSNWKENGENEGTHTSEDEYKTLDYDVPVPPPIRGDTFLSRRAHDKIRSNQNFHSALNNRYSDRNFYGDHYNEDRSTMSSTEHFRDHMGLMKYTTLRDKRSEYNKDDLNENIIHITYPPSISFDEYEKKNGPTSTSYFISV